MHYLNFRKSVDKRYNEIKNSIRRQAPAFLEFLRQFVLDDISYRMLLEISSQTDVYVFSGVIRNYLLGEPLSRDLDIVVRNLKSVNLPMDVIRKYSISKNSFGGYKVKTCELTIDIWDIESTWSLVRNPNLRATPNTLLKTAFFNFSAIVYDIKRRAFVFGYDFTTFYGYKEIDVVNECNPNDALCIVNTMYYAIKLEYPIRYKLCKWVVEHYKADYQYEDVQLLHFHSVLYSKEDIEKFRNCCVDILPLLKKNKHSYALKISDNR